MAQPVALVLACCVGLLISMCSGQTCELWAGDPAECASVLNGTSVYLYGNLTQSDTSNLIRNLVARIVTIPIQACLNASLPFACKNAFPRCVLVNDTIGEVPVWEPQCRATCEAVNDACALVYQVSNTSALNCTASNSFVPSLPFYPVANLSLPSPSGNVLEVPCEGSVVAPFECPMTYLGIRLVPIPKEDQANFYVQANLPCWKCPFPAYYTEKELHVSWYGTATIGGVATVLSLFVIAPNLLDKRRRQYPAVAPVHIGIAAHGIGWSYLMAGVVGFRYTFCTEPWLSAYWDWAPCAIQMFSIHFFSIASATWTVTQCFNVWWTIVQEKQVPNRWHLYHALINWGYSFVNALVVVGLKQARFNEANSCFISDYWPPGNYHREALDRPWVTMLTWYWPIAIFLIVGLFLIFQILYKVLKTSKDLNMARKVLYLQWRTFGYFVFFTYTCGYVIFLWVNAEVVREEVSFSTKEYIACLFAPPTGDSRDCRPSSAYPKWANIGVAWTDAFIGIWLFIVFGLGRDNLAWWRHLFRNLRRGNFNLSSFTRSAQYSHSTVDLRANSNAMRAGDF